MADLPKCPPSAKELLAEQLAKLDPRGPFASAMDDAAAKKAHASEGLLGIPLLDDLLDQTAGFLTDAAGSLVNELAAGAIQEIAGSLPIAGAVMSLLVSIATIGSSMSMLLQLMMIENLRKQVAIRLFWLEVVQFHYKEIYKTLQMLKTPSSGGAAKNNMGKIVQALAHVKKAEKDIQTFQTLQNASNVPQIRLNYFKQAYFEIDGALKILLSTKGDGTRERDLISGVQSGVKVSRKGVSLNNQKIKKAFVSYKDALIKDYKARVLGRTVYIMESLAWHNTRLLPAVPLPFVPTSGAMAARLKGSQKLGYTGATFDPDAADKKLNAIKAKGVQRYRAIGAGVKSVGATSTLQKIATVVALQTQEVLNFLDQVDFQKALVGTNLIIDGYIETMANWESDWSTISDMSKYLLVSVAPVQTGLKLTREGMENSINQNDNEFIVGAKEILWITALESMAMYKNLIQNTLEDQATRATQAQALEDIKAYLQSDTVQLADDAGIVTLLKEVVTKSAIAPFNEKALNNALVTVNMAIKFTDRYILYNDTLYGKLGKVSVATDPTAKNISTLLDAMSLAGGAAGTMATAIALGQLGALAANIATMSAALKGLDSLGIAKCTPSPKSEDPEATANSKYEAARRKQLGS